MRIFYSGRRMQLKFNEDTGDCEGAEFINNDPKGAVIYYSLDEERAVLRIIEKLKMKGWFNIVIPEVRSKENKHIIIRVNDKLEYGKLLKDYQEVKREVLSMIKIEKLLSR